MGEIEIDVDSAMVAMLRLAVAEREERLNPDLADRKTESILYESGLSYAQIASMTGRKPDAVRKIIARSRG